MQYPDWKSRIIFIKEFLGLDNTKLGLLFGCSHGTVQGWIQKGSQPGLDKVTTFSQNHPEFSPAWLAAGEGAPFRDSNEIEQRIEFITLIDDRILQNEIKKLWGKQIILEKEIQKIKEHLDLKEQYIINTRKKSKPSTSSSLETPKLIEPPKK